MFGWLKNMGCSPLVLFFLVPTSLMMGLTMCSGSATVSSGLSSATKSISSFFGVSSSNNPLAVDPNQLRQNQGQSR